MQAGAPRRVLSLFDSTCLIVGIIAVAWPGKTILVATHDPRMLSVATDKIYLLDGKQVSEAQYHETIEKMTWEGGE